MNLTKRACSTVLFVASATILPASCRAKDPSPADPFSPIKHANAATRVPETWSKIVAADETIRRAFAKFSKAKSLSDKDVGKLYVVVEQYRRYQRELEEMGDPSYVDFQFRGTQYGKFLTSTLTRYWGMPQSVPQRQKVIVKLQRDLPQRTKRLEKIAQALGSDAQAAETQLDQYMEDVFLLGGILAAKQKDIAYQNLDPTRNRVRSAASSLRHQQARSDMLDQMKQLRGEYDAFIASLKQQSASASPDTLQSAIEEWKQIHIGFVRLRSIKQLLPGSASRDTDYGGTSDAEVDPSRSRLSSDGVPQMLAAATIEALSEMVASGAREATPAEAAEQYHRYLQILSDLGPRLDDESLLKQFDEPLSGLAEKAGMAKVVTNYHAATDELLEWKRRAAASQAEAMTQKTPAIKSLAASKLRSIQQHRGMYSLRSPDVPVLLKSVPELMGEAKEALVGANVSVAHVRGLDGGKLFMSQLREGFYARLPGNPADAVQSEVSKLRSDLLLGESDSESGARPLSLSAAMAIGSAASGSFDRVGGELKNFVMEAALSRYADVPSIASCIVPIGFELPQPADGKPQSAIALRVDLVPVWFQHRYFLAVP